MSDGKKAGGFAAMASEKVREIAAKGAAAVTKNGTRYKFTKEAAQVAGRKGAAVRRANAAAKRSAKTDVLPTEEAAQ